MCHNFGGTHLADIFPTRAEMCHKNSRTSPAERRPKSTTDPECVTNVSRMCHKKVEPKSTFWEVTSLHLEPADLVNKHVLPKVKEAASQSFLMRKLPKGSASMTRLFSYRRRSRKRASSGVSWVSKWERVVEVPAAQQSSSRSPRGGAGRRWTMHCLPSLCL